MPAPRRARVRRCRSPASRATPAPACASPSRAPRGWCCASTAPTGSTATPPAAAAGCSSPEPARRSSLPRRGALPPDRVAPGRGGPRRGSWPLPAPSGLCFASMEELCPQPAGETPAFAGARAAGAAPPHPAFGALAAVPAPVPAVEEPAAAERAAAEREEQVRGAARSRPLAAGAWLAIGLATLVYAGHAWLFRNWVIDDAGISFVYARNLAAGHGLVSQPGMPPVEGYSNFLWVLLLAPAFRLGLFHPLLTPKLLSLALVGGSFGLLDSGLRRLGTGVRLRFALLLLLSLNTAFVIWTSSGLENPLYVFLLCALFRLVVAEPARGEPGRHRPVAAGLLVSALALTRPDGILAVVLYPLLTPAPRRDWLRRSAVYGATVAVSFGAFLAFRLAYFGQLLPNTYYAKGGIAPQNLWNVLTLQVAGVVKLLRLLGAVAGGGSGLLALALVAGASLALARGWLRRLHLVTAAFTAVPALAYMLLPVDWMPGFRFATGTLPFLYAFVLALAATFGVRLLAPGRHRFAADAGLLAAAGLSAAIFVSPSLVFAARPTVPFSQVAEDFGAGFNRYAELLGVRDGSILLPDLGGTLYASRLRVYDLA